MIASKIVNKVLATACSHSITEICLHDIAELRVIAVAGTCETTVLICSDCGKELEEPNTDCR
jgi:hypothetical protein